MKVAVVVFMFVELIGGFVMGQQAAPSALPDVQALMRSVEQHQAQLEKVRENYTYSSLSTTEDLDSSGQVKKTVVEQSECFYVHGHLICRTVQRGGAALDAHDAEKETERVTKLVEKAEKTPSDQPLSGPKIEISHLLSLMDVRNPRREQFRGRTTIVFDFVGRKDAQTNGLAEDASKKLKGTIWVDEKDHEIARLEASYTDNFNVGGGILASVRKGSQFNFDQAPVRGELWLPTGAESDMAARVLLVKGIRQKYSEHDSDYKNFSVDAVQQKSTAAVGSIINTVIK